MRELYDNPYMRMMLNQKRKTPNINCKLCQRFSDCVKVKNPKSCEKYREKVGD
jgi:hypothetical protein